MDPKSAWEANDVRTKFENGVDVIEDDEEELWIVCGCA